MAQPDTALRKRQQIAKSNRAMFMWVAGASVLVGIALVVCWFLAQKIEFNTKVYNKKQETILTLEHNNKVINELKDNIRALEANEGLNVSKASPDDKALQVILDALPADANSLALGASLQNKFINGNDGLNLESLSVDPVSGVETSESDESSDSGNSSSVRFRMTVSAADPNTLKDLLARFERSIRVIDIDSLTLESSEGRLSLAIEAKAYYEPAREINLRDEKVKP